MKTAPYLWVEPDAYGVPTVWCDDPRPGRDPAALLRPDEIRQHPHYVSNRETIEAARARVWSIIADALPSEPQA